MYVFGNEKKFRNNTVSGLIGTIFTVCLLLSLSPAWATTSQWTPHGPYGGAISSLVTNKLTTALYAATSSSGIFKSTDGGTTWGVINAGLTNPVIQALAMDPTNPAIIYAGASDGLFKSTDGGNNWALILMPIKITNGNITSLAIDPVTPSTIYAGTNGGGTLKSTNSGAGWAQNLGMTNNYVTAMAVDPLTPATIYAGTNGGVFKSINSGGIWSAVNTGLSNLSVKALAMDPVTTATIYAATSGGIFKTINSGATWNAINVGLAGIAVQAIIVDAVTPATVYAATTGGVFKSTDAGANWSAISTGLGAVSVKALFIDPIVPATVYAGSSAGGVFKSTTAGGAWAATNAGLSGIAVQSLVMDATTSSNLYAGNSGYGIFKSADRGSTWNPATTGLTSMVITAMAIDPLVATTIYAGTSAGVFKSSDTGGTWSAANTGLSITNVKALGVDPITPINIYAGTMGGGLFKSSDGGTTWTPANTGLLSSFIYSVAVDPVTPSIIYAGTLSGGIYKSSNGGTTWSTVNNGIIPVTSATVNVLAVNPVTPATIFAGTSDGLFKSIDAGVTWTVASTGLYRLAPALRSGPILAVAFDPITTSTMYVFVNGAGIYKSVDGGLNWGLMTPSLSSAVVYALIFDRVTPSILYAAANDGMYTLDSSILNHIVTFNSNGGTPVAGQTVSHNTVAATPTAPTWSGYTFAGWYSDVALTVPFVFSTLVTANTTLYAKWTPSGATPIIQTITWTKPVAITYGALLSGAQLSAVSSVPGTFAYTPAAGALLTAGTQTLSVTFTPADTVTYTTVTTSVLLTVNRATPVLTWATPPLLSLGTPLSVTQLNAAASVPGVFAYLPTSGAIIPTAGVQILSATFTPVDTANYTTATVSVPLTVNASGGRSNVALAANGGVATVSSTNNATTYPPAALNNGDRIGATWGSGGGWNDATLNSYPDWAEITFSGLKSIDEIDVFTLQDALTASIAPTAAMTFTKYGITAFDVQYCPQGSSCALTGTTGWVTVTGGGIAGNNLVWKKITLTTPVTTDRIRVQVNASLGGYSRIIEIEAYGTSVTAPPVIQTLTWANPSPIAYGSPLTATQLNAVSSVPGTFVYTPASGTLPATGPRTLSVTFTPTDTVTYAIVTASVTLNVNGVPPLITWTSPAPVPAGTLLSATQLNAVSSVPGTFVYTPGAGTLLTIGVKTLSGTFTPTDTINYSTVTASVTLNVTGVTPTITWGSPASAPAGTLLSATQLNAAASVPGTFVYTPAIGTPLTTGTQTLSVIFNPTDTINYTTVTASVTLTVTGTVIRGNVALAANGGVAAVSSTYGTVTYPAASLNNGDRIGTAWGKGGGWNDATLNSYPDWAQITFNAQKTIDEIDVITVQDALTGSIAPTATMTFTKYGITAFDIQYCPTGSSCTLTGTTGWVTVTGGGITGNNLVWKKITLTTPVTTDRIRVQVNNALGGYSRIVEIESYGY